MNLEKKNIEQGKYPPFNSEIKIKLLSGLNKVCIKWQCDLNDEVSPF